MKFTLRKDGKLRVTMRPAFHIGYEDVTNGIYHALACGEPAPRSRKASLVAACDYILKYGLYHTDDNIDQEYWDKAEQHARKLFPELAPAHEA